MTKISVTVADRHFGQIHEVARMLQDHGMQVEQILDGLGIITGSVADDRYAELQALSGVDSVDEQLEVRLPPPDSPVQ